METAGTSIPAADLPAKVERRSRRSRSAHIFPALDTVTRSHVTTAECAYYINRQPQTLRGWASSEAGALRPIRICGRLAWPVAEIKLLLGVAQ